MYFCNKNNPMGKHGIEILDLDKNKLIRMLNEALAEDCLSDLERMKEDIRKLRM
jgi:hypothetical protein